MTQFIHDTDDTNEALLMHDISHQLKICFDRRAQPLGLTRAQWRLLSVLRRNPGIRQSRLAGMLEIEPITLARLLGQAGKNEWIRRKPDPGDRRANCVVLTDKVQNIIVNMRQVSVNVRQQALDGFSRDEHAQLVVLLKRLKRNVGRMIEEIS